MLVTEVTIIYLHWTYSAVNIRRGVIDNTTVYYVLGVNMQHGKWYLEIVGTSS